MNSKAKILLIHPNVIWRPLSTLVFLNSKAHYDQYFFIQLFSYNSFLKRQNHLFFFIRVGTEAEFLVLVADTTKRRYIQQHNGLSIRSGQACLVSGLRRVIL